MCMCKSHKGHLKAFLCVYSLCTIWVEQCWAALFPGFPRNFVGIPGISSLLPGEGDPASRASAYDRHCAVRCTPCWNCSFASWYQLFLGSLRIMELLLCSRAEYFVGAWPSPVGKPVPKALQSERSGLNSHVLLCASFVLLISDVGHYDDPFDLVSCFR